MKNPIATLMNWLTLRDYEEAKKAAFPHRVMDKAGLDALSVEGDRAIAQLRKKLPPPPVDRSKP